MASCFASLLLPLPHTPHFSSSLFPHLLATAFLFGGGGGGYAKTSRREFAGVCAFVLLCAGVLVTSQGWSTLQELTGVSLGGRRIERNRDEKHATEASADGKQGEDDSEAILRRWRSQRGSRLSAGAASELSPAGSYHLGGAGSVQGALDAPRAISRLGLTAHLAGPVSEGPGHLAHAPAGALAAAGFLPRDTADAGANHER